MLPKFINAAFGRHFGYAHLSYQEKGYRTLALSIIAAITLLDLIYNLTFFLFGQPFVWYTTLTYFVASSLNLWYFKQTNRFRRFRNIQTVLTILLPLAAQITHGGFSGSSGVMLAAFLAPLGTLMFASVTTARRTFFAYLAALLLAGIWEYFAKPDSNNLPDSVHLLFFEFNFAFMAAVAYFLMEGFLKNKTALLALLRSEHEKSDKLLLDILPAETARELKENGCVTAKSYEAVTVMFTDFVQFSAFSRQLRAEQLVEQIDFYFRAFDDIVAQHGLEKIKTIGDSYMCAGGIPLPTPDHALRMVAAAVEIRRFVLSHRQTQLEKYGYPFDIRIGLHTGAVVAGVVGSSKIAYDIWGETVNIAARMEQHSEANCINISEATHALVHHQFECRHRGRIPARHIGEVDMYYVERPILD